MIQPPLWTRDQLEADRLRSVDAFRKERLQEPLEAYLDYFEQYQAVFEDLLEQTVDLTRLRQGAAAALTDHRLQEAIRYLTGPPISLDDWKVVADATLSASALRSNAETVDRLIQVVLDGLDRRRFPWIAEGREASESERHAAVLASAALIATRRTETLRRNTGKDAQEERVEAALLGAGLSKVPTATVRTLWDAPAEWSFCRESLFGTRKADFLVKLGDRRVMPIECKVSNSYTNSIKRLNNDAAVKAQVWIQDFGAAHVVPTAILGGVFKLRNLEDAQRRGLTLFWAHHLEEMVRWISATRE